MESTIRPSSDLRNRYAEVSRQCKELRKPIHITVNGRGDTVLLSEAEFERMQTELETAAKPWEKDALTEMAFNNGLQALKYMPVFTQRNSHPYRCIPYLDDAIEQLQLMMKGYGPVQKEAFLSLLASLTPKQ